MKKSRKTNRFPLLFLYAVIGGFFFFSPRALAQEDVDKKRKEDARNGQPAAAPQGKMGRGTALLGKKRRKATEPQPAETKPGSGKQ